MALMSYVLVAGCMAFVFLDTGEIEELHRGTCTIPILMSRFLLHQHLCTASMPSIRDFPNLEVGEAVCDASQSWSWCTEHGAHTAGALVMSHLVVYVH